MGKYQVSVQNGKAVLSKTPVAVAGPAPKSEAPEARKPVPERKPAPESKPEK